MKATHTFRIHYSFIRNHLRNPQSVQNSLFNRPGLLLMAERHSTLLYADTKIRAVTGSEPRT